MKKLLPLLLVLGLLLSACGAGNGGGQAAGEPAAQTTAEESSARTNTETEPETETKTETEPLDHTVITFNGTEVEIRGGGARDEGGTVAISAAGTYEITGVSSGKALVVNTGDDPMDVTVILNNAHITCPNGPAIHVRQAKHFRLRLAEGSENSLTSGTEDMLQAPNPEASGAALYSEDDMDIEGEGSLKVYGYLNNAIGCKNDLDINSGSIAVLAANNGVRGNDSVQIKGGALSVSALGDGIKSSNEQKEGKGFVEILDGSIVMEVWGDGIQAATELRIEGGSLTVTTKGDGVENSSKALKAETLIRISGGSLSLNTQEDGVRCGTGNVEISGGSLDILSPADGISAGQKSSGQGDILVSGGELTISAGKQAMKARGSFAVTGGSIRALCGSEKQDAPTEGVCLRCLIAGSQGDAVQLSGLGSVEARQNYKCLLFASPELSSGQTVTVTNRIGSVEAEVK